MKRKPFEFLTVILILLLLVSCQSTTAEKPTFDGQRAFEYLSDQVAMGPRVPGSEAIKNARSFYYDHFQQCGLTIDSQAFTFYDPYSGTQIPLVNVIASFVSPHKELKRIALVAHYDSRPRTDSAKDATLLEQPIDGANDGASGVAVLMELAKGFSKVPPPVSVDLVLVDGEDWGKSGDSDYYLLGSREFARSGIYGRYEFAIVIDMIGDKDQKIYREGFSEIFHPLLNDMIWKSAAELGLNTFVDSVKDSVLDDHIAINSGGVPAINIIDFDYDYWHTEFDTPDKCSPEALENVGRLLIHVVYNPELWPKKK